MLTGLTLALVVVQLTAAQLEYPRFIRLPTGYSSKHHQCYDAQVDKHFDVGEVWSSPYSNCKQSKCVDVNGKLHIDRYACPSVTKNIDFRRLKSENLYCRQAVGDRTKAFPECCPRLSCKHYVGNKLMPLPEHMYPYLKQ